MASALDALVAWLDHLANERRASPRTVEAYGDAVRRYLTFLTQHRGETLTLQDLGMVSAAEVRAYLAVRRQGPRPLAPRSVALALSAIRGFHRFADRRLGVANAGVELIRGPRVKPSIPRPLTEDQAFGLIGEAESDPERDGWETARDAALLTLLYGCGLRISEALSLTRVLDPLPTTRKASPSGTSPRVRDRASEMRRPQP